MSTGLYAVFSRSHTARTGLDQVFSRFDAASGRNIIVHWFCLRILQVILRILLRPMHCNACSRKPGVRIYHCSTCPSIYCLFSGFDAASTGLYSVFSRFDTASAARISSIFEILIQRVLRYTLCVRCLVLQVVGHTPATYFQGLILRATVCGVALVPPGRFVQ